MKSRMRGNSHVRFGARDEEACLGNAARRFIPTLPKASSSLSLPSRNNRLDLGKLHKKQSTYNLMYCRLYYPEVYAMAPRFPLKAAKRGE